MVSARIQHALSEMNVDFRPGRVWFRAWYERTPIRTVSLIAGADSADYSAAGISEVHFGADLPVCRRPGHPARAGSGARTGRTRAGHPGNAETPGLAAVVPTRRRDGPMAASWHRAGSGRPARRPMCGRAFYSTGSG